MKRTGTDSPNSETEIRAANNAALREENWLLSHARADYNVKRQSVSPAFVKMLSRSLPGAQVHLVDPLLHLRTFLPNVHLEIDADRILPA